MFKKITLFSLLALGFIACEPSEAGHTELGALPSAEFTITEVDSNTVRFTSNSTGAPFLFQWEIDGVGTYSGEETEVFVGSKGMYEVTHRVFNQGGSDTAKGQFEIFKDGPPPCAGVVEWLTECSSRTWKLAPQAGAIWVGTAAGSQFWAIDANGPTDRPCMFNDEWTFNDDGTFAYEANGDFWGEPFFGFNPEGCFNEAMLQGNLAAWQDGTHAFEIIPGNGPLPDQLKVSGLGAFVGLHKVANGTEVSEPVSSITYDILSMTEINGERFIELEIIYNSAGNVWRFTLYSQS